MTGKGRMQLHSYERSWPVPFPCSENTGKDVINGVTNSQSEGASDAESQKKRPGRPKIDARREGNNLNGCKPFLAQANRLLEKKRGSIKETTVNEKGRKYKMLNEWLTEMRRAGKISTTVPQKITEEDVRSIMEFLAVRAPDQGYRAILVGLIEQVLISADNSVIQKMRTEGYRFPKAPLKPIRALSEDNLRNLQNSVGSMEGWRGDVARFMVWILPYTGLRPSELRLAHLEDVDIKHWLFYVRHPKGEGRYGVPQWMPILPPARSNVIRYLEARERYLKTNGKPVDSWPLVPSIYAELVKEYSSNNLRDIKEKIEEHSGLEFKIKDFRPTCAQMIKDRNKGPVELATKQLRHSGPDTTYRSYAQIRSDTANEEVNNLFREENMASMHPDRKTFLVPEENINAG
jgi:integrase